MGLGQDLKPRQRDVPRVVWSWAMYDWANSAFTTLVVTFIYSTYYTQAIAPDRILGTAWWSRAVGLSALIVALSSPFLGAAADRGGWRRRYLLVSTVACIVGSMVLAFVSPSMRNAPFIALAVFVPANVAFEMSMVFYNAFLPGITTPDRIGRVSGYGWGLGYVGGLLCMVLALVGFVGDDPWFGLSTAEGFNVRATNLLVAAWFLVFSVPFFLFVPENAASAARVRMREVFAELGETVRSVRRYRDIVRFLIARLVYNDGLVTIFAFGGIYAAGTFGMTISEVVFFGIVLNVTAGIGAFAFGFVDDRIGGKRTILITLVALILSTALAVAAPDKTWLWVAGVLIGIFLGPNQAASRSLMGRFTPERKQAEFFGFYAFSGKITAFAGPLLLGVATQAFDSQRAGVAVVVAFFVIGGWLLLGVDERSGVEVGRS